MSRTNQKSAREQARAAARAAEQRRPRNARLGVIGGLVVAAAALVGVVLMQNGSSDNSNTSTAGGLLTGPPPWPAQAAGLEERVAAFRFPPVGDESYHAHALLSVFRDGEQVAVPADLGYSSSGAHTSLHAHTPDGVIHMEADDPYPYQLAHVMATWGVAFDSNRLGGDVATGDKQVHVYVNGKPATPEVVLQDGDNVVVAFGTEDSFPPEAAAHRRPRERMRTPATAAAGTAAQ